FSAGSGTERLDRLDGSGSDRGVEAREDADGDPDERGGQQPGGLYPGLPSLELGDDHDGECPERRAHHGPDGSDDSALGEEVQDDVASSAAEGTSKPDLGPAFEHGD